MIIFLSSRSIWVRTGIRGAGFTIKFPWDKPLFSERHGHRKPRFVLFGFRVIKLSAMK